MLNKLYMGDYSTFEEGKKTPKEGMSPSYGLCFQRFNKIIYLSFKTQKLNYWNRWRYYLRCILEID